MHQPRIIRKRVPPYQRDVSQGMPQNVVNVQTAVNTLETKDISEEKNKDPDQDQSCQSKPGHA